MNAAQLIWTVIFALGSIQGVFLGFILFHLRRRTHTAALTLLAALVLTFALTIAEEFVEVARLFEVFPHVLLSTLTLPLLIGPLLFLHGQCLTQQKRHLTAIDYLHFLPFVLATLYLAPFYVQPGSEKLLAIYQGTFSDDIVALAGVKGSHMFAYFFVTIHQLRQYLKKHAPLNSNRRLQIIWYKRLIYAMIGVLLITGAIYYPVALGIAEMLDSDYIASLFLTAVIYAYAFVAIKYPGALSSMEPITQGQTITAPSTPGDHKPRFPVNLQRSAYHPTLESSHRSHAFHGHGVNVSRQFGQNFMSVSC